MRIAPLPANAASVPVADRVSPVAQLTARRNWEGATTAPMLFSPELPNGATAAFKVFEACGGELSPTREQLVTTIDPIRTHLACAVPLCVLGFRTHWDGLDTRRTLEPC